VGSRDLTLREGVVLVPLVAAILFFALYPQLALHRGEPTITQAVHPATSVLR
jgi:NADH-quinone oxidoreductase subunit M